MPGSQSRNRRLTSCGVWWYSCSESGIIDWEMAREILEPQNTDIPSIEGSESQASVAGDVKVHLDRFSNRPLSPDAIVDFMSIVYSWGTGFSHFEVAQQAVQKLREAGVTQGSENDIRLCSEADAAPLERIVETFREFERLTISSLRHDGKPASPRAIRRRANCALVDHTIEELLASGELRRVNYYFNFRDSDSFWNHEELRYVLESSFYYTRIPLRAVRGMLEWLAETGQAQRQDRRYKKM